MTDTDSPAGPGDGDVGSPPTPWWRRWWAWTAAAALVLSAVVVVWAVQDDETGEDAAPTAATTTEPTTTTSTTVPTTTTESTTTTIPDAVIVLGPEGLGAVSFGDDGDSVVGLLTTMLGRPDEDAIQDCGFPGPVVRYVSWADLTIVITGSSVPSSAPDPDTRRMPRRFVAYAYGRRDQTSANSPLASPLTTAEGIGVGSTVADVQNAYGQTAVPHWDEVLGHYTITMAGGFDNVPVFRLAAQTTGDEASSIVTVIEGGEGGCGV